MRIWYQGLSQPERKPAFYRLLNEYARKVGAPGTEVEFHGLITGGLGDNYRSIEMLDAGLYDARELVNIPVLGILETAAACHLHDGQELRPHCARAEVHPEVGGDGDAATGAEGLPHKFVGTMATH